MKTKLTATTKRTERLKCIWLACFRGTVAFGEITRVCPRPKPNSNTNIFSDYLYEAKLTALASGATVPLVACKLVCVTRD